MSQGSMELIKSLTGLYFSLAMMASTSRVHQENVSLVQPSAWHVQSCLINVQNALRGKYLIKIFAMISATLE